MCSDEIANRDTPMLFLLGGEFVEALRVASGDISGTTAMKIGAVVDLLTTDR